MRTLPRRAHTACALVTALLGALLWARPSLAQAPDADAPSTDTAPADPAPPKAPPRPPATPDEPAPQPPRTPPSAAPAPTQPPATTHAPTPAPARTPTPTRVPPAPVPRHARPRTSPPPPRPAPPKPVEPLLPGPSRFTVAVGVHREWRSDRGYERFGKQAVARVHVVAGADALRLAERFALAVEAGFEGGMESRGLATPSGEGQLRTQSYTAALVPRYQLTPWLWPHLRVGAGAIRSRIRFDQQATSARTGDDWGYVVDLAAGLSLAVPEGTLRTGRGRLRTLTPFARVEAGYRWAPDASFGADEHTPSEEGALTIEQSPLGSLSRGAAILRVIAGARF